MRYLRVTYRLVLFLVITLLIVLAGVVMKLFGAAHRHIFQLYNLWKWLMTHIMGIEVSIEGKAPETPGIIMANHRSYVDLVVTPGKIPFVIVAKKSVKSWPVVGWGGKLISTIWVDRDSKNSRHETRKAMKERLEKGGSVLVFPEGTTSKGPGVLPLKPGMFFVCAEGGFPVLPLAIEYENPDIAWVGKELFIPHLIQHFGQRKIRVKVRFGAKITANNGDELKLKTQEWLVKNLREMRDSWDS
ncbi:hypothetical protein GC194_00705 [bacterium]|nr:hypothetical protein [bacterium]